MTPASSVLLLTTLTGFGYGLIAWLGALAGLGFLPHAPLFVPVGVIVGLGFANAGLVASTLHLGHPERAWRASASSARTAATKSEDKRSSSATSVAAIAPTGNMPRARTCASSSAFGKMRRPSATTALR